jgi:hypothetical protein
MPVPPPAFLDESLRGAPGRVALFGKHPSAADHMEDLGIATPSLAAFRQGFYIDGIGGALAKQTWYRDLGAVRGPEGLAGGAVSPFERCTGTQTVSPGGGHARGRSAVAECGR